MLGGWPWADEPMWFIGSAFVVGPVLGVLLFVIGRVLGIW